MKSLWKSVRKVRIKRLLLLVVVLWLWVMFVLAIVIDAYGRIDRARPADVIVVLGAGLRANNQPGPALTRRAAHAALLWQQGYAPVVICSGGNPGSRARSEAAACAELLQADGVPTSAIVQEEQSRSTEENALYTRSLMLEKGWQTAIVVSDGYHLFRARRLFVNEGISAYMSPADVQPATNEYIVFLLREVAAFNWQLVKEALNLPVTYVQGI
ncbi:MAG: YdcF family protein [Anaerolineae bacterium]|nr:YdcF family protein [Anaerolineae bacterium]